jgi:FixJ family two-component response regulator
MTETPSCKAVVHIVDDDESLRTAVVRLLGAAGYETRTYSSAGEFALLRDRASRGCVLLDLRMPGPSGLELQSALLRQDDAIPVIFLTGHGDIPMSVRAMKAGAIDFLTKPVRSEELLGAIKTALARDSLTINKRLRLQQLEEAWKHLTPREQEVFQRVTAGQPNKQIASELDMAERTVKAHRAEVMRKMDAASLAELVQIAGELSRGLSGAASV